MVRGLRNGGWEVVAATVLNRVIRLVFIGNIVYEQSRVEGGEIVSRRILRGKFPRQKK